MSEDKEKKGGFWSLFKSKSTKESDRKDTDRKDIDRKDIDRKDHHQDKGRRPPPPRRRSDDSDYDDDDYYRGDDAHRRRRSEPVSLSPPSSPEVASPRRSKWLDKGKGPEQESSHGGSGGSGGGSRPYPRRPPPNYRWPPSGVPSEEDLSPSLARDLISKGAPSHIGHKMPVQHAADHYFGLYSTTSGGRRGETDAANLHDSMTQLMTMRTLGPGAAPRPWDSLEQPSYAFRFGRRPGTVTLNHWVSTASVLPPSIALRDSGVAPRDADLEHIMWRLQDLERGLEDDDEPLMYKNLYRYFLRDPDRTTNPHRTLDRQITDLIMVLSRPDHWIDFTESRNQIATRFIYDTKPGNNAQYVKFFHQLLLSCELDLRINSRHHHDQPRDQLLSQLPPTIQWGLALSRRWREHVRIDEYGETAKQVKLRFKLKRRQMKMLKRFAQMMKWPNLAETLDNMAHEDSKGGLCNSISSHAMAFFSGLVLPGPTFPFLIMNSLIDLDPDRATDELALLTPVHPSCGFQYRNSYTYWTSVCIVGKVLAPTCHEVGGWIGPARPTSDLGRTQIARIRTRRPPRTPAPTSKPAVGGTDGGGSPSLPPTPVTPLTPQQQQLHRHHRVMTPESVLSMATRSDALGPPSNENTYPAREFRLPVPDTDSNGRGEVVDTVRMELLTLKRVDRRPRGDGGGGGGGSNHNNGNGGNGAAGGASSASAPPPAGGPGVFDASLQFAIDGVSWPLRLSFDVEFVCAWPCGGGTGGAGGAGSGAGASGSGSSGSRPHPLSYEFEFASVPVDRVVEVRDWAGMFGNGAPEDRSTSTLAPGDMSPAVSPAVAAVVGSRKGSTASVGLPGRQRQVGLRPPPVVRDPDDDEKVLVVEAFGVPDNEVLARAWCAHFGVSAVVADIKKTCMSCAIREAYAANITVVILVEDRVLEEERMMGR